MNKIIENITISEIELTKTFGSSIWLYSNILDEFAPELDVTFIKLDDRKTTLIVNYINAVNKLLSSLTLEEVKINKDNGKSDIENLTEAFINSSTQLYYLRFQKAKANYADYKLLRTNTWLEDKMISATNYEQDYTHTYSIYVKNAIKTNSTGDIDIQATDKYESNEHCIKIILSLLQHAKDLSNEFYRLLEEDSEYQFFVSLYSKELIPLMENIINIFMTDPVKSIYMYLKRNYTVSQAITNSKSYYQKILSEQNNALFPKFTKIEKLIDIQIDNTLNRIKELTDLAKADIKNELKRCLVILFNSDLLFPHVYYQLAFRNASKESNAEYLFNYVIDTYSYENGILNNDYPIQTYGLILSDDSKKIIFNEVTNGQINPNYTLEDYLMFKAIDNNDS